jgi:hypothetical protein
MKSINQIPKRIIAIPNSISFVLFIKNILLT